MPPFNVVSTGVPNTKGPRVVRNFGQIPQTTNQQSFTITGLTLNQAGVTISGCVVDLFRTADDSVAGRTVSDENGLYLIYASSELTHYAVAYLTGPPDLAGTTVNTLVGT